MGMYTELVLGFRTKNDGLAQLVSRIIKGDDRIYGDRRDWFLTQGSYYFPCSVSHSMIERDSLGYWNCSIRCSTKNYDDQIAWFISEILSKLEDKNGELLGYYRYEEDHNPTLIWATADGKDRGF